VSTKRSRQATVCASLVDPAVASVRQAKFGWSRSPVDWTSNRRYEYADARKRSPFQRPTKQRVLTPNATDQASRPALKARGLIRNNPRAGEERAPYISCRGMLDTRHIQSLTPPSSALVSADPASVCGLESAIMVVKLVSEFLQRFVRFAKSDCV